VSSPELAAVVLAGGTGVRMGGAQKAGLRVDGRTLLEHALASLVDAVEIVVVGDPDPAVAPARFVREEPPYAGPGAALLTGLAAMTSEPDAVALLAVDMPRVSRDTWRRLREAAYGHDGAALVDASGRRQLAMVLGTSALRACAPPPDAWPGLSLKRLLAPLDLAPVTALGDEAHDVDTWADLRDLEG